MKHPFSSGPSPSHGNNDTKKQQRLSVAEVLYAPIQLYHNFITYLKFSSIRVLLDKNFDIHDFLVGSKAAFLRLNELIGSECIDELREMVSDDILKAIQISMEENSELSTLRPHVEITGLHHYIQDVQLRSSDNDSKLWIDIEVMYIHSGKVSYQDRQSNQRESTGEAAQHRETKLRFTGCLVDRNDETHEICWIITALH